MLYVGIVRHLGGVGWKGLCATKRRPWPNHSLSFAFCKMGTHSRALSYLSGLFISMQGTLQSNSPHFYPHSSSGRYLWRTLFWEAP